jgi:hypothetical protein
MIFKIIAGKHRLGNKVYTVGQKFNANTNLAELFPKRFELVGGKAALEASIPTPVKKQEVKKEYEIDHKGGGYYNIIDIATGDIVSEKAIRNDAEAIRVIEEDLGGIYVGRPAVGEED